MCEMKSTEGREKGEREGGWEREGEGEREREGGGGERMKAIREGKINTTL